MKSILYFLLATICRGAVTDYSIDLSGPHHVVQGRYFTFNAQGKVITGTDDTPGTVPTVANLPPGATVEFPILQRFCCGTFLDRLSTVTNAIRIMTTAATPPGTYTVQVNYAAPGGVNKMAPYTVIVDPVPVPPVPVQIQELPRNSLAMTSGKTTGPRTARSTAIPRKPPAGNSRARSGITTVGEFTISSLICPTNLPTKHSSRRALI